MNEQFSVFTTGLPTFFQEMTHILIRSVEMQRDCMSVYLIFTIYI